MATDRQIAANQRNAQRSTGPKTTTGKSRSKLNALRHGLTAEQIIIPGEDPGKFEALRGTLIEELEPDGEMEARLVERITACMWRLRRLTTVEAGIFAHEYYSLEAERAAEAAEELTVTTSVFEGPSLYETQIVDEGGHEAAVKRRGAALESIKQRVPTLGVTFMKDAGGADALGKLSRYEANIERSLYRALHELQRLQTARKTGNDIAPVVVDVTIDADPKLNDD